METTGDKPETNVVPIGTGTPSAKEADSGNIVIGVPTGTMYAKATDGGSPPTEAAPTGTEQ